MKTRLLISVALVLLGSHNAFSQEEVNPMKQKKISFDAHVGMNLSTYHYSVFYLDWETGKSDRVYKPGLLAGVGMNIGKGKSYSFNPEVNYSQMGISCIAYGNTYHVGLDDGSKWRCEDEAVAKETLHYLEIPLYSKWTIGNRKIQPFIALAPTFSFGLKGTRSYITDYLRTMGDVARETTLFKADKNSPYSTARYNVFDYAMKVKAGATVAQKYEATFGFGHSLTSFINEAHELHFSDCIDADLLMGFFFAFSYRF